MTEQMVSPYIPGSTRAYIFDFLKDGQWRTLAEIEQELSDHGKGESGLGTPLRVLTNDGLVPKPPKYPMGQWRIIRRRKQYMLKFQDPVEGTGVDEAALGKMVSEAVSGKVSDFVKTALEFHTKEHMESVMKQIEEMKKSSVPILELSRYEGTKRVTKTVEPAHEMMTYLLYWLNLGEHVYLHDGENGGPGSGKSTAAIMAAAALGRRCGYISLTPTTFESRLFGYMDARGKYVGTDFRECYEKGGVFIIDEMDNGSGNLYTALNGALENNICSFPDKQVKRHQDFVVVGTGNTSGGGPNPMFPTRRPFDKAFAERFTYIAWNYDERLERSIALAINPEVAPIWHDYTVKLRAYCRTKYPMVLSSPRATFKGCKYMRDGIVPMELMMNSIIFKGYDKDSVKNIMTMVPPPYDELKAAILEFRKKNEGIAKKSHKEVRRG